MPLFKKRVHKEDQARLEAVIRGNTAFALDLYQELRATQGNLFVSPYSISTALAMTYAGARGDTQIQMAQALHFLPEQKQFHATFALLGAILGEAVKKGHIQLNVANALWPRKGYEFLKGFLSLTKKYYASRITPVDYDDTEAARKMINSWVEEKTESKIKDLIPSGVLDSMTRLVLVNAIYFRGEWAHQFDPALTSQASFFTAPDVQVQVQMMTRKQDFRYAEDGDVQILELPYAGDDLSMILLLPREINGLEKLEASLNLESLDKWMRELNGAEVEVSLPRFEVNFPFRLDDTLKTMGMVSAFSNKADFSGMDGSQELFIGAILHKAFVAVNEQGTEAAAATAAIMQTKTVAFTPVVFRADHPFVFFIRANKTRSILFMGRLANPA
jgi:serpin B